MRASLSWWCAGPAAAHGAPPAWTTTATATAGSEPAEVAHLRAARAAVARGDLAEALARFDDALRIDPGLPVAHLGRAVCLAALARQEEAHASLHLGLANAQVGPGLARELSRVAAREGNGPLAMDLLGHALAHRPDAPHDDVLDDPAYGALRDHPRLLAMLGRL